MRSSNRVTANLPIILLIVYLGVQQSQAVTQTYYFEDGCFYNQYTLDNYDTYYVEWDGTSVGYSCSMGFHGEDSDILDEFKVCVEAETFYISSEDCGVYLTYKQDVASAETEKYGCGSFPLRWCSESDKFIDITLLGDTQPTSGNSNFRLKVTAEKTYDDQTHLYINIGYSVGGVCVFIILLSMITVCVIRRRRNTAQYARIQPNIPHAYGAINTTGPNPYQSPYGTENASKVFTHPPPYNGLPSTSSNPSRATPPPPYTQAPTAE